MTFSRADLQIIDQNPLDDFHRTFRKFFLETTDLTIKQVQEKPEILNLILKDATRDEHSRELFQVFLCHLSLTDAANELKHPSASTTSARQRILLFASEWPNQMNLPGSAALDLCANALFEALAPETTTSDRELWRSVYTLLSAFPAENTKEASANVAVMVKDYLVRYAREHPYLLAANIGLTLVPLAIPLLLGAIGFTSAGVSAGSAAAAWQSSIGLVSKGSLFAGCQSVAMSGLSPMVSVVGTAVSWSVKGVTAWRGKGRGDEAPDADTDTPQT